MAELEELVGQLRVENERLRAENEQLRLENEQLRAQRVPSGQDGGRKNPKNSSIPPSQAVPPGIPPMPVKPRRKKGRRGTSRCRTAPDHTLECRPERCHRCGRDLEGVPGHVRGRSQQVEIPPVQPIVTEVVRYCCVCPSCGERNTASPPAGWDPRQRFGQRLQGFIAYLHHHQHISYQRLRQLLKHLFGLWISEGAIAASLERTAGLLQPTYAAIRDQVRRSAVVGSDETRQRVAGRNEWSWVVQSADAAYHWVGKSRAASELLDFFNGIFPQVQESDCYSAQLCSPVKVKQVCMAHQLRDLKFAEEQGDREYSPRMARLIRIGIALAKRREVLGPVRYRHQADRVIRLAHGLGWGPTPPDCDGQAMQRRYQRLEDAWWVFLERADVQPTNNASERALRPVVVHRKVRGSFRSRWGADAYAKAISLIQTAQKQGRDPFAALMDVLLVQV